MTELLLLSHIALVGVGGWPLPVNKVLPTRQRAVTVVVVVQRFVVQVFLGLDLAPGVALHFEGSSTEKAGGPARRTRRDNCPRSCPRCRRNPRLRVSAATSRMARSLRSALKSWFGPMPVAMVVVFRVLGDLLGQRLRWPEPARR